MSSPTSIKGRVVAEGEAAYLRQVKKAASASRAAESARVSSMSPLQRQRHDSAQREVMGRMQSEAQPARSGRVVKK